ncbi:hypothetical protein C8R44DRAFT_746441 [Mycena epipterygia]|nr:hypothetical protein C8R44DRAFT_746441 [Mycena epipterygia]
MFDSMQQNIDEAFSSLRAALDVAFHQELQRATPPSSLVASHTVVQRERLHRVARHQATLLAGMRAAAVCLHPTNLPGPSNAGLAGVNWRVRQRPGEDEEAALKAEIHRLQVENTVLLSSIQAAVQALNDMRCGVSFPRVIPLSGGDRECQQIDNAGFKSPSIVETLLERHCVKHIVPPGANQFHQSLANEGNGEGRPFPRSVVAGFPAGHLNGGRSIETLEFQPDWEVAKYRVLEVDDEEWI